jgi:hypothetical protein
VKWIFKIAIEIISKKIEKGGPQYVVSAIFLIKRIPRSSAAGQSIVKLVYVWHANVQTNFTDDKFSSQF